MKFNPETIIINVKEARKVMGKESNKYTDEQIQQIISELIQLTKIIIDDGLLEKYESYRE